MNNNGKRNGRGDLRPGAKVRDYDFHVLICKGGDCKKQGSKDLRKKLKKELRAEGINRDVRIDAVDCLGLCKHGPNVVVYPSGTWYLSLDKDSVPELVEHHLKDGQPVEHLAAQLRPRKKK
ncbi:MAG: ferredoxin [Rubrobacteraceae bacterium]